MTFHVGDADHPFDQSSFASTCSGASITSARFLPDPATAAAQAAYAKLAQEGLEMRFLDGLYGANSVGERLFDATGTLRTSVAVAGAGDRSKRCTEVTLT